MGAWLEFLDRAYRELAQQIFVHKTNRTVD